MTDARKHNESAMVIGAHILHPVVTRKTARGFFDCVILCTFACEAFCSQMLLRHPLHTTRPAVAALTL